METHGYLAIQEFKKLQQAEEQKQLASKFIAQAWRPKRKYRFDLAHIFKLNTTNQDLGGLVRFLKGENPVTFGSQYAMKKIKLSGQWQDALEQFNEYLFKVKPGFKALKKGYDRALKIPTIEQYKDAVAKIGTDKFIMKEYLVEVLPAMEGAIFASIAADVGHSTGGLYYLKKQAVRRFGRLSGTIRHRIKLISKIEESLNFLKALLRQEPSINKVKKGEAPTLATVLDPKDAFSIEDIGSPETSSDKFYKTHFPIKSSVSKEKIQSIRKQIFAWQRTYNKSMIDYMNTLIDMEKQFNWFKRNSKNLIKIGDVGTKNFEELRNAQNSFNKIKEEVEFALPFVGGSKMFDIGDPTSDESKAGMAVLAMDSALLWSAIATASATAGGSLLAALGYFVLYETALALGISHVFPYIIKQLKYVWPNLFARDTPY